MKLMRSERVYYIVQIDVSPTLPDDAVFEASFDEGANWKSGTLTEDGYWSWLVAGPDFDPAATGLEDVPTATVIPASVTPWFRVKNAPELDVEVGTVQITVE